MCNMVLVFAHGKWYFYCVVYGSLVHVKESVLCDSNLRGQNLRVWSFDPDECVSESWQDFIVNDSGEISEACL